jgi:hypothetical protein
VNISYYRLTEIAIHKNSLIVQCLGVVTFEKKNPSSFLNSCILPLSDITEAEKCCPINKDVCQDRMCPQGARPSVASQQVRNLPSDQKQLRQKSVISHRKFHRFRTCKII